MRYIGGKTRLLSKIDEVVSANAPWARSMFDIFAGSGAVSSYFKRKGFRIVANDICHFSYVLQRGGVGINRKPTFEGLGFDAVSYLNALSTDGFDDRGCFVLNSFSPHGSDGRMYFQPENAKKIDVVRQTIEKWRLSGALTDDDYYYLLSSLIRAVPYVSNIAGVYAAYLKFWDKRTYNSIALQAEEVYDNGEENLCMNENFQNVGNVMCDIMYADPPYNSREYLPNYHVLETISRYDNPPLKGVTGMRPYSEQKSDFCSATKVETAFESLLSKCKCEYAIISYNNEGLMPTHRLEEVCKDYAQPGSYHLYEYPFYRYKSRIPNEKTGLKEQLYFLKTK